MMNGIFITGTDTGIGKTYFTIACIQALRQASVNVIAMKPVASGAEMINGELRNDDALQIQAALDNEVTYKDINPYCFEPPVSPHIASDRAGVDIELSLIKQSYNKLASQSDYMIVEGVGGWLAPLSEQHTVEALARVIGLPVVMVVGVKLGCLSQAMLTAQAIKTSGLTMAGWVANCVEPGLEAVDEQIDYLSQKLAMPPMVRLAWQSPAQIDIKCLPGVKDKSLYIE